MGQVVQLFFCWIAWVSFWLCYIDILCRFLQHKGKVGTIIWAEEIRWIFLSMILGHERSKTICEANLALHLLPMRLSRSISQWHEWGGVWGAYVLLDRPQNPEALRSGSASL